MKNNRSQKPRIPPLRAATHYKRPLHFLRLPVRKLHIDFFPSQIVFSAEEPVETSDFVDPVSCSLRHGFHQPNRRNVENRSWLAVGNRLIFMSADKILTPDNFRRELGAFWDSILEIEPISDGLAFTMPLAYPDGWQIVLELTQKTPKGFLLSDQGKTLSWLTSRGHNISTDAMRAHLQRYQAEHFLEEKNGVLFRWLSTPLEPADIQVFAEGLAAIARLEILPFANILTT